MRRLIAQVPFLELAGLAKNATEAMQLLEAEGAHLLFLDIQMPGLSGLDLARSLPMGPPVIFTTAHPGYALEGYELNVLDYLLKPITIQRFLKAAYKAKAYWEKQEPREQQPARKDFIFIKSRKKMEKVPLQDILFLEAKLNYVLIQLENEKMLTYASMKSMVSMLPSGEFMKVHRSYIVSLPRVRRLDGQTLLVGSHEIPINRGARTALLKWLTYSGSPPRDPS